MNKGVKPFHSDEIASGQRCDTDEAVESLAPADIELLVEVKLGL